MSFAGDLITASVVTIVAFILHRIMVELVNPSTALYGVAQDATNLNGAALAWQWAQIGAIWIPLIAIGGIWTFVIVRMYRRQVVTGAGTQRAP